MAGESGLVRRPLGRWGVGWRIGLGCLGFLALLNGSLRCSDDVWPFGPMSQYAFSPAASDTIVITRVEGENTAGARFDLPLRAGVSGIGRAEVEARIPAITADPALLQGIAEGWMRHHPDAPLLVRVWLVQDVTQLERGHRGSTTKNELTTWAVR